MLTARDEGNDDDDDADADEDTSISSDRAPEQRQNERDA
jgi:hypothetical protein